MGVLVRFWKGFEYKRKLRWGLDNVGGIIRKVFESRERVISLYDVD